MRQPKNGLINLINNQANRSDNDAPQDQCCFVVFMSFGGLDSKFGLVSRLVAVACDVYVGVFCAVLFPTRCLG